MKQGGILWFPHMCSNSDALRIIQCDYGISGYGVVYKLYERIFSNGYYTKWNDKICKIFAFEDCKLKSELVANIVESCLEEGIFECSLFDEYGILTSAEIQKKFYHVAKHRENFKFDERFVLIEINNAENVLPVNSVKHTVKSNNKTNLFTSFMRLNSIDDYICFVRDAAELKPWIEQFEPAVMVFAIFICLYKKRCNLSYLNGILGNWKNYGYVTLDDVKDPLLSSPEFLDRYPEINRLRKLEVVGGV